MKLEQQLTSLPLSQRLQKLGVPQESLYAWTNEGMGDTWHLVPTDQKFWDGYYACHWQHAAYTVSELGMLLPKTCKEHSGLLQICPAFSENEWFVGYGDHINGFGCHVESGTLAEACGEMLAYLLENGLITSSSLVV